jgi:hypothetical protein
MESLQICKARENGSKSFVAKLTTYLQWAMRN